MYGKLVLSAVCCLLLSEVCLAQPQGDKNADLATDSLNRLSQLAAQTPECDAAIKELQEAVAQFRQYIQDAVGAISTIISEAKKCIGLNIVNCIKESQIPALIKQVKEYASQLPSKLTDLREKGEKAAPCFNVFDALKYVVKYQLLN